MKKLVYIASTGYSGTTLLDMLLNNHAEVSALGEVYLLSIYAKNNSRCTCGEVLHECDFWEKIESALKNNLDDPTLSLATYPLTVEAKVQSLDRKIPKLNDILLLLGSRRLWEFFSGFSSLSKEYMNAARNSIKLFQVVSEEEATSVIVDSSKFALPLKALYLCSPVPVRVIFMGKSVV